MSYIGTGLYYVHVDVQGKKKRKTKWRASRAASAGRRVLRGVIFLKELRQPVKNAFVFPKPGSLTHISEEACQLMAY